MKLSEVLCLLAKKGELLEAPGIYHDSPILGVTDNADWIESGFIFVAIKGAKWDGHEFIPIATERGAVAVVGQGYPAIEKLRVPYIRISDARRTLAIIANGVYGNPSRQLKVVGVTGTKGKTTTTWLTRHLLSCAGYKTGLSSTVGYKFNGNELHQFRRNKTWLQVTTPDAPQIQQMLEKSLSLGCSHFVIEASSHGLELQRLCEVGFDIAIWTHLTPEHLDFHGDVQNYFAAKRKLVERAAFSVLNREDPWVMCLTYYEHCTYSCSENLSADWQAINITQSGGGMHFEAHYKGDSFTAYLPILGYYNVANALTAMAAAHHLGVSIEDLQTGLASFRGVPGRMELIQETPIRVVVDFAHTPMSLKNVLQSLRAVTPKRLIVVIGCGGGDRSPDKRAPLGAIATRYSDYAILTEEDCRYTPIMEILNDMKRGADMENKSNYTLIPDRREAIYHAITIAKTGDTVVLCGKGTEAALERSDRCIPWNEAGIVKAILREIGGRNHLGDSSVTRN